MFSLIRPHDSRWPMKLCKSSQQFEREHNEASTNKDSSDYQHFQTHFSMLTCDQNEIWLKTHKSTSLCFWQVRTLVGLCNVYAWNRHEAIAWFSNRLMDIFGIVIQIALRFIWELMINWALPWSWCGKDEKPLISLPVITQFSYAYTMRCC